MDGMFSNFGKENEAMDEYWEIVQMTFESEEECYSFYNSYAEKKGFSVRKDIVRREKKIGDIFYRRFVCSKEGCRDPAKRDIKDRKRRERAETREHCTAELSIRLDKDRGVWFVDNFLDDHNHTLTSPDGTQYLRSHRRMKDYQKSEIMMYESKGIRKHRIMDVFECTHGDKVGFIKKDIYNFSSRYKRSRIEDGDANATLKVLKDRRDKDPEFFFDYEVDSEGRLKTLFWCDGQSRMDYQSFGDVVVFDSTYRMNRYKMPFVPFVGLNHHRQTVVFGCGIVSDEKVSTYKWLLRTFLRAMCQKKPKSIITDSDNAMIKAIRRILPGTDHRVCSWHIEKNMKKHLHFSYLRLFRSFIYEVCPPDVFEEKWSAFVQKYQTNRNKEWLNRMYKKRRLWAAAFLCGKYFMGMRTNQRSESLNSRLHVHLDGFMSLYDLVQHYEVCVSEMRRRESELDTIASQSWPVAVTDCREIEKAAAHVFTFANFELVQEQLHLVSMFDVGEVILDGNRTRYRLISNVIPGREFSVDYTCLGSDSDIKCNCRKIERDGIPCKHIFLVLKHAGMTEIPKCCVLQRVSKNAKAGLPSVRKSDLHVWTKKQSRYHELRSLGSELFDLASGSDDDFVEVKDYLVGQISRHKSSSKPANDAPAHAGEGSQREGAPKTRGSVLDPKCVVTKGAPKGRIKSFDEPPKPRLCSGCREPGHDIRKCPEAQPK
jgi:zinc finger SWIM domain-containing protein 3